MARTCTTTDQSVATAAIAFTSRESQPAAPSPVPFYTLHVAFTPYGPEPLWIWISDLRRGDLS